MIKLNFNSEMVEESKQKARKLGVLNNSIRKGKGNFIGYLGQLSLQKYLNSEVLDTYNNDLIYKGETIEVKTKERSVDPTEYYEASIAETSLHQDPDVYAFLSITIDNKAERSQRKVKNIWLCGFKSKDDYFKEATYHKKGDKDNSNNFIFKANCYNLSYSNLDNLSTYLYKNIRKIKGKKGG